MWNGQQITWVYFGLVSTPGPNWASQGFMVINDFQICVSCFYPPDLPFEVPSLVWKVLKWTHNFWRSQKIFSLFSPTLTVVVQPVLTSFNWNQNSVKHFWDSLSNWIQHVTINLQTGTAAAFTVSSHSRLYSSLNLLTVNSDRWSNDLHNCV